MSFIQQDKRREGSMNIVDKKALLLVARDAIAAKFERRSPKVESIAHLTTPMGLFVTLTIDSDLRGCIGFPLPELPLNEALVDAAQDAAFRDPRFRPLAEDELEQVELEINLLTAPEIITVGTAEDYYDQITVGVDGLLIRGAYGSGLLLPSVAERLGWSTKSYLEGICQKAGLPIDGWQDSDNKLFKFQSIEFSESDVD
jgi:AmmeMemoRadiSam system protein A